MKLEQNPSLPQDLQQLVLRLSNLYRQVAVQVNMLTEGRASAVYNALTAPPTTGQGALGDFVRNAAPSEQGASGSKYIVLGWSCVSAGTPGTWVQVRSLTGN